NLRIVQRLMYLMWPSIDPLTVFPVLTLLRYFADIDFSVEIRRKGLTMIACVAVNNVEIVNLLEMVLRCISSIDIGNSGVKAAAQDCSEPCFFELVLICPLPFVFKLGFVLWLIVGCVKVSYSSFKTGIHYSQILIGEGYIDY